MSWQFHPVKARRFLTLEVNANTQDPTGAVLKAISREDIEDAIVRLYIKVSPEHQGLLQEREIRKALERAHTVAALTKEVQQERRTRLEGRVGLTPLEYLKTYLESKKTPPERARVLLEYGERLLQEEQETARRNQRR